MLAAAVPAFADADVTGFWDEFTSSAPWLLRFGLRVAVWALTWLPVLRWLRPLHRLSPERQDHFLAAIAGSRIFAVRQLAYTVKHVACFALMRDPAMRSRWGQ